MGLQRTIKASLERLAVICLITTAGLIGPAVLYLIISLAEFFRPEYDPIQETISALAIGQLGWLPNIGFFISGFLLLFFTMRLYLTTDSKVSSRIGAISLLLISIGLLLVGIFPTRELGVVDTVHSQIHAIAARAIFVLFTIASFSFAIRFKEDPRWRKFYLYTFITGIVEAVLIILYIVAPSNWHWLGLHERLFLANSLVWIAVISIRLLKMCILKLRTRSQIDL